VCREIKKIDFRCRPNGNFDVIKILWNSKYDSTILSVPEKQKSENIFIFCSKVRRTFFKKKVPEDETRYLIKCRGNLDMYRQRCEHFLNKNHGINFTISSSCRSVPSRMAKSWSRSTRGPRSWKLSSHPSCRASC
jgi:hypothetical protein